MNVTDFILCNTAMKISCFLRRQKRIYQFVKNISLVDMDSDKCLKLNPVKFAEVLGSLGNECVQHDKKILVCSRHDFTIRFTHCQC